MGGGFGITILYILYIVIGAPILFLVLSYRARKSQHHPYARGALVTAIISMVALSIFGAFWWLENFPQDLSFSNIALLCAAPGFVLGACFYGLAVKIIRLLNGGGYT